jgi:hypothetical protein
VVPVALLQRLCLQKAEGSDRGYGHSLVDTPRHYSADERSLRKACQVSRHPTADHSVAVQKETRSTPALATPPSSSYSAPGLNPQRLVAQGASPLRVTNTGIHGVGARETD